MWWDIFAKVLQALMSLWQSLSSDPVDDRYQTVEPEKENASFNLTNPVDFWMCLSWSASYNGLFTREQQMKRQSVTLNKGQRGRKSCLARFLDGAEKPLLYTLSIVPAFLLRILPAPNFCCRELILFDKTSWTLGMRGYKNQGPLVLCHLLATQYPQALFTSIPASV